MRIRLVKIFVLLSLFVLSIVGFGLTQEVTIAQDNKSLNIYACNLSFQDNIYIVYGVESQNITDKQNIKILSWLEPQDSYAYGTQDYTLSYLNEQQIGDKTCAIFENNKLSAKQMTEVVYSIAYYKDGENEVYSEVNKYSILQYAYNKINTSDDAKLKTALESMLDYGAAMQNYFNYKTDRLANATYYQINLTNGTFADGFTYGLFLQNEQVKITTSNGIKYTFFVTKQESFNAIDYACSYGLSFTLINNDAEYEVHGIGSCPDTNLIIPSTYNNKPVTSIGEEAFYGRSTITSIKIPSSVTKIGKSAFSGCSNLATVTLSDNLTTISDSSFNDCTSLKSISIPNSLKTIGKYAFSSCKSLTTLEIPESVEKIGEYAFSSCTSLTTITIPNSDIYIANYAFRNCFKLVEVINKSTLPITKGSASFGHVGCYALNIKTSGTSEVVYKNDYLFYTYDSVNYLFGYVGSSTQLTLPSDYNGENYHINQYAFIGLSNLTSVTIPNCVNSIGQYAFSDCTSLTKITIPNSVTEIGEYAFYECVNATELTLSNNISIISDYAFYDCTSLTSLTLPNSVTEVGRYAFADCHNITSLTLSDNLTYIGNYSFLNCLLLTSLSIPEGVTIIGSYAFFQCWGLTSVTLPTTVTTIGSEAFGGCYKLIEVINKSDISSHLQYVFYYALNIKTSGTSEVVYKDDYLFYSYGGVNYLLSYVGKEANLTLPSNYNGEEYQIFQYAFAKCTNLLSITTPDFITKIDNGVFYLCENLTTVTIPNTITRIGNYAFYYCENLTTINIPNTVTEIGEYAFWGCLSLTAINIPKGITIINKLTFYNCISLKTVSIPDGVISISTQAFDGCGMLELLELPNSVNSIGDYAFFFTMKLYTINYKGTKAQWEAINKGYRWNLRSITVHCTDGDINVSDN